MRQPSLVRQARGLAILYCLAASIASEAAQETPGEEEEHAHRNDVAIVIAGTYEAEEETTLFTIGGEYTRRLSSRWEFTTVAEYLPAQDAWVVIVPFGYRLFRGLWVSAGPGFEGAPRRGPSEETSHAVGESGERQFDDAPRLDGRQRSFLVRGGVTYAFELGERYSLKAGAAADWVDTPEGIAVVAVYGISLGIGF